ncbi:MAG: N-6 DNA methylase, partial [Clostridia bacterium]|nr:N-6 DNA methylase [Clostridia bacterium]
MKKISKVRAEKKQYGVFYTPQVLARCMAESAIERYCLNCKNLQNIRIVDLSCGDGRFLEAALEVLLEKFAVLEPGVPQEEIRKRICENNLFGIDRDEKALRELRKKLPVKHLFAGDALRMENLENSFDVVLGNPPYVSYGVRNTGKLEKIVREDLIRRFPGSAEYKISIYAIFTELGVRVLREG